MRPGAAGVPGGGGLLSRQPRVTLLVVAHRWLALGGRGVACIVRPAARAAARRAAARSRVGGRGHRRSRVVAGIFWPGGVVRHYPTQPTISTTPTTRTRSPRPTTTVATTTPATTATTRRRPSTTAPRRDDPDHQGPVTAAEIRAAFTAERPFPLDQFQSSALDALDAGRSVLVAAPTGSGKTLVAEYAIARALAGGREGLLHDPAEGALEPEVRRLRARATARSASACSPATTRSTATHRSW